MEPAEDPDTDTSVPLRLLALDSDDLAIISAALQDAVVRIGDIHWNSTAKTLTLSLNRFRWEIEGAENQRVLSGFQLGAVLSVRARNLRPDATDAIVQLLAVRFTAGEAPGGDVTFAFADGADLVAGVECIEAVMVDMSPPWVTQNAPEHWV